MPNATELFSLEGKVSIVTGASRGLGYGLAVALAGAGSTVVLVSRSRDDLIAASERIGTETGGDTEPLAADLTKPGGREDVVRHVVDKFGRVDVLVNNAGMNIRKPFLEMARADFQDVVDVNLAAVFFLTQAVADVMIKSGGGKVINIASLTSYIGIANISAYGATKGAVASLTRALAVELAPHHINVNAIAPGYFRTELTEAVFADEQRRAWIVSRIPLGRPGTRDDLAGAVIFLASAASDYITGHVINVDGGWLAS